MDNGNSKALLPVKSDFVFKLIFGDQRNADILAGFLKSVLDIPDEEYGRLTIADPTSLMMWRSWICWPKEVRK